MNYLVGLPGIVPSQYWHLAGTVHAQNRCDDYDKVWAV
jgi:hypothetical protein